MSEEVINKIADLVVSKLEARVGEITPPAIDTSSGICNLEEAMAILKFESKDVFWKHVNKVKCLVIKTEIKGKYCLASVRKEEQRLLRGGLSG